MKYCLPSSEGSDSDERLTHPGHLEIAGMDSSKGSDPDDLRLASGVARERILVDPGFGFAKTVQQNLEIIRRLRELRVLQLPVVIGPSRKGTIGRVLGGLPVQERVEGTAAAVVVAIINGADVIRVHDVRVMTRVARMTDAIVRSEQGE